MAQKPKPSRAVEPGIQRIIDGSGDTSYKAQVRRKGHPQEAKRFATLADARKWKRARESEIDLGVYVDRRPATQHTLGDLMRKYRLEVTPTKRGQAVETCRLLAMERDPLARINAAVFRPQDVQAWIARRAAKGVSGSTINRELGLLSHIATKASKSWHIPMVNPVSEIERPEGAKPRDRRISEAELEAICAATGSALLPVVLRLAVLTGMRRSEILGLQWEDVDLAGRMALLRLTKNGESRRVPLNKAAVALLDARRPEPPESAPAGYVIQGPVFEAIDPHAISTAMRRAVTRARAEYVTDCLARGLVPDPGHLVNVRFHDGRHEAVSRLVEAGVDQLTTARIVGHKSLSMTNRYFTPRDAHLLAAADAASGNWIKVALPNPKGAAKLD